MEISNSQSQVLSMFTIFFTLTQFHNKHVAGKIMFQYRQKGRRWSYSSVTLYGSSKEVYQLFLKEHPEIKISLSNFCSLRPVNVLLSSAMPRDACLCQYHENIRMLCEYIALEIQALPPYSEALVDNFVCDSTSEFCMTGKCAKCPNEWLLEITADAPLHETTSWCQWDGVTHTMPGKWGKGQQ